MRVSNLAYLLILLIIIPTASAWARHDQITTEAVQDTGWLERFSSITVTESTYDDPSVRQTIIAYYNNEQRQLGPDEFYYHSLYEPVRFFTGADIGQATNARQIITEFSDEPDWELDQGLELSWLQAFSGESQGYRHMYYPAWTFHIPLAFYPQGQTPERAGHFYRLAKTAFANNDTYWGFRFLARALHYVQDMSQPYHTRQLYWRFIDLKSPYRGTEQTTKNHHFAYESYQANLFRLEQQGEMPKRLVNAVHYSLPVEAESPEELVKHIARESFRGSSATMKYSVDFLGEGYNGPGVVVMTKEEFFNDINRTDSEAEALNKDLEARMLLAGKATKSFLEFARRDLELDE
jgi:hypothetical protein